MSEPSPAGDLDDFTQELVRENELLIADVDALRENEDRLIEQVEALRQQLASQEEKYVKQENELRVIISEKDSEMDTMREAKEADMKDLQEDLMTTKHTLTLLEESSQAHHEQMEAVETELEEARDEINRLQQAAEETLAQMKDSSITTGAAAADALNKAVTTTLSELNSNAKFLQATVQSIFKCVKGNMVFSMYGDPMSPFEHQPTPSITITDRDVSLKEADIAKMHKKISDTIRRVEGFASMSDARATEVGMSPQEHPYRTLVGISLEACTLLFSLYNCISKVGLVSAANKYSFADTSGMVVLPNADVIGGAPASSGGSLAAAAAAAGGVAGGSQAAAKPSTSKGLGLWAN